MKKKIDYEKVTCVTNTFRVSFPEVFKAKAFKDGQEAKFSIVMLFDKKESVKSPRVGKDGKPVGLSLQQIAVNAATEKWGPKDKWPKGLDFPFRDGDEKPELEGYPRTIYASAKSKQMPGLVGPDRQPILNEAEFYAGCYARAEITAYAYDTGNNKGVGLGLKNIQKIGEGAKFSGRKNAEDVFDSIDTNNGDTEISSADNDEDDLL
jgi:hypothetical protein